MSGLEPIIGIGFVVFCLIGYTLIFLLGGKISSGPSQPPSGTGQDPAIGSGSSADVDPFEYDDQ